MKLVSRAQLRGRPLGKDCEKAKISKHEYGPERRSAGKHMGNSCETPRGGEGSE